MTRSLPFLRVLGAALFFSLSLSAQRDLSGVAQIRDALGRASTVGSVLMIAAHPDDENTALLAYYARGRHLRTGYLSLTRGEGGQNLIGSEQGDLLGVIRTQELLAARRIDGAEQYFTRAIDFGFTKTTTETFARWGREKILSDVVYAIRSFRPDVVILRFSGTPRDGHGQHQASAILGKEAFFAAADPARFPEQLATVQPWRARRLMFNLLTFSPETEAEASKRQDRVEVDTGDFDPVLGHSFAEIAGMSRSEHRSQAMGSPERRGSAKQFLVTLSDNPATRDAFDGIDTSWQRIPGGAHVGEILEAARRNLDDAHPDRIVPGLLEARQAILNLDRKSDPLLALKLSQVEEAIALCSGLWLDAAADRYSAVPGSSVTVRATTLRRSPVDVRLARVSLLGGPSSPAAKPGDLPLNQPDTQNLKWTVPADHPDSQPFWLAHPRSGDTYTIPDQWQVNQPDSPPVLRVTWDLVIAGTPVSYTRPVIFRFVERDRGERTRPFTVVPPVDVDLPERSFIFPSATARRVEVELRANAASTAGSLSLQVPEGWKVEPASQPFSLAEAREQKVLAFTVTPPVPSQTVKLRAVANVNGHEIASQGVNIDYPHIPPQVVFPPATAALVRAGIQSAARRIGYIMGAGDQIPESLRQIGLEVTLLGADDLAHCDLAQYDAVVAGVRAYNVRSDLRANQNRLLDYVKNGGTYVVQYNVLEGFRGGEEALARIGPYPITISRERVTEEDAPVTLLDPQSPLLNRPNEITAQDFEGWVQERGLYFASQWDPQYHPLFATHDKGEKDLPGGTLYARYGKGIYIFTAWSWFRQLPAGVPGAYRIFANLLSAGKVAP